MSSEGSVTNWLRQLEAGDRDAARRLWERYFQRLVGLARGQLQNALRRVADEEDVALTAFASFCRAVEDGRCADLPGRDSLWGCLVQITAHKVVDHARRQRAEKRGGGAPAAEADLEQVIGREPTPDFAAQVADECRRLLDQLPDDTLRSVAVWKMESYTVEEIAAKLGVAPITIHRKLARIREVWAREIQP